jgi:hypothetical protein
MEWSQLAPALTRIGLSSLGAALGGPAGAILANTLGPVIAEAVGGPAATPASTQAAIEKDPAAAAEKLQALEDGAAALLSKQIDLNAAQAGSAPSSSRLRGRQPSGPPTSRCSTAASCSGSSRGCA